MKSVRVVPFLKTKTDKEGFHVDMVFQTQVYCECGKFFQVPPMGDGVECEGCKKMFFTVNTGKTFSVKEELRP